MQPLRGRVLCLDGGNRTPEIGEALRFYDNALLAVFFMFSEDTMGTDFLTLATFPTFCHVFPMVMDSFSLEL